MQEAAELDLGDHFIFRVGRARPQAAGAPLGGYRFTVEAHLAGRLFSAFPLDVGQGDEPLEEAEWKEARENMEFAAGILRPKLAVYPLADQFAEKLHAYTRPRENPSRVKDLVDLTLILDVFGADLPARNRMLRVIRATFKRYGTHEMPDPSPPPEQWRRPFEAAVRDLGIRTNDIGLAHRKLNEYIAGLSRSPS